MCNSKTSNPDFHYLSCQYLCLLDKLLLENYFSNRTKNKSKISNNIFMFKPSTVALEANLCWMGNYAVNKINKCTVTVMCLAASVHLNRN